MEGAGADARPRALVLSHSPLSRARSRRDPAFLAALLLSAACPACRAFVSPEDAPPAPASSQQITGEADRRHDPTQSGVTRVPSGTLLERDALFGSLGGARDQLAERGVTVEALLTAEASRVLAGGVRPDTTSTRYLLDVQVDVATEQAFGWPGGELLVLAQQQGGDEGADFVGDAQTYSNLDADGRTEIAKIWWRQELFDGASHVKIGKIDANSDFAYVDNGARFINSSMGYSPTILGLPTYPDPAFGAEVFVTPEGPFELGLGVFDGAAQEGVQTGSLGPATLFGAPGDLFTIAELRLAWGAPGLARHGRLGAGAWHHSGSFPRFDGGAERGTAGVYLVLDQGLWHAASGARSLDGFLQWGLADPDVSVFHEHLGLGVTYRGWCESRPNDALGVGASSVRFTDAPGAGLVEDRENALEIFAAFEVTPWLRLKPDLQFLDNPGGKGDVDDAWVATLRATVSL